MSRWRARTRRLLPPLLGAVGIVGIVALVRDAGAAVVLDGLVSAGPWLGLLIILEVVAAIADVLSVRALHGPAGRSVPLATWARGAAMAVTCLYFLPGGRVLGEVARASTLTPHVGPGRAAAMAVRAHGTYLFSISLSSLACYIAIVSLPQSHLALSSLVLFSAGFTAALGALFLLGPRVSRIGSWLGRRLGFFENLGPAFDEALAEGNVLLWKPLALYIGARFAHLLSSVALLAAVGVGPSVSRVLTSEGIQLVAANTGDAVPGQAGVLEGAYRAFAGALGLGDAVALAVTAALLLRVTRVTVGASAAFALVIMRGGVCRKVMAGAATSAVLLVVPMSAHAQSPAPEETKLVVRQRVVAVINPMGAEHMLNVGVRIPLGDGTNALLADTHFEAGFSNYTSPVYTMTGGYAQLSPVAFLVLRAELTGMTLWSIGMDGAGFYPVDGYDADTRAQNLPAALGQVASGFNAQLSAILQAATQLGRFRPIFFSQLTLEHERLGEEGFHYSPKYDLVLARSDTMLASSTMLLGELELSGRLRARLGAYDDLRHVFNSGATSHQLGAMAMIAFDNEGSCVRELLFFGRAGAYLEPARRAGQATGLVGFIARYDLAGF